MSDHQDLLDAIEARLNTVANIGVVHDRVRFSAAWDDYLDHFKTTIGGVDQIRGWQIVVPEIASTAQRMGAIEREYRIEIFGILGLADGSNTAATFIALVALVLDALDFRTDLSLSGVVDYSVGPATARFEERMFGSVLCHAVTIVVPATVRKTSTYA